jgi:hypothetical protein
MLTFNTFVTIQTVKVKTVLLFLRSAQGFLRSPGPASGLLHLAMHPRLSWMIVERTMTWSSEGYELWAWCAVRCFTRKNSRTTSGISVGAVLFAAGGFGRQTAAIFGSCSISVSEDWLLNKATQNRSKEMKRDEKNWWRLRRIKPAKTGTARARRTTQMCRQGEGSLHKLSMRRVKHGQGFWIRTLILNIKRESDRRARTTSNWSADVWSTKVKLAKSECQESMRLRGNPLGSRT